MTNDPTELDSISELFNQQCAAEPIHLLGSVQPHGFVMAVDRLSGRIVQVSAGAARHWPGLVHTDRLFGTSLDDWIAADQAPLATILQGLPTHLPALLPLRLRDLSGMPAPDGPVPALEFECVGHALGSLAVLEWMPIDVLCASAVAHVHQIQRLNIALDKLRQAETLDDYFQQAVLELQSLSGYDRVMLYRFLPDWSGEVVAEHTGPGFEPRFIGLRFPATDIPPQARKLYETNTLRLLADTEAVPDRLLPAGGPPLDQSHALLRSLSQAHVVYLRNMGVRATLVLSLMVGGRLWGMLACHHHQPRVPPYDMRTLMRSSCELIASFVATRISDLARVDRKLRLNVFEKTMSDLGMALRQHDGLGRGVQALAADLCEELEASRFGFRMGAEDFVSDMRADEPGCKAVLDDICALGEGLAPGSVRQVNGLRQSGSPGLASLPDAAGVMVARTGEGLCFFTRPEQLQQVHWAGDPGKSMVISSDGRRRLEPRLSFALWSEQVAGCAQSWSVADEQAARRLAIVLDDGQRDQVNRQLHRQLDWQARHDELTGLCNRSAIEPELARRMGQPAACVALFLIDIDHFKRINDALGHQVGDKVLQEAGRRFVAASRGSDLTVRMGGDEFLLIASMTAPVRDAIDTFAERLHEAFTPEFAGDGWSLHVRISVGAAYSPDHGTDAATLIRHADMALYEAKGQGRGCSAVFDLAVESRIKNAIDMESQIQRAVVDSEFRLYYQPKVDLRTQRVVGVEALVRWQHPARGLLSPDHFIPLSERNGQIEVIGRWVIGEAAAQLARWRSQGAAVLPIAVNVSFVQIASGSVVDDIRQACALHDIPFEWLELELTETVMMENTRKTIDVIRELAELGLTVALDDFGTGYSSLAHVRQLPLDCLKIDRSFVSSLEIDPQSDAVTKGVIGLAHGLNLATVAEGVETSAQLQWLVRQGCDVGQGYLFSRPVSAAELPAVVRKIESADWGMALPVA